MNAVRRQLLITMALTLMAGNTRAVGLRARGDRPVQRGPSSRARRKSPSVLTGAEQLVPRQR